MAGSQLRFLNNEVQRRSGRQMLLDLRGPVANDDGGARGPERIGCLQDAVDQGASRHAVEHFRQLRFHARAFAGGQDHNVEVGHEGANQGFLDPLAYPELMGNRIRSITRYFVALKSRIHGASGDTQASRGRMNRIST